MVIGAEQRGHLRRVARAAGVLEEQRVEQLRAGRGVELEVLRETHADHAAANRVPGRLALGDVERVGERPKDLGEAEPRLDRPAGAEATRHGGCWSRPCGSRAPPAGPPLRPRAAGTTPTPPPAPG